jgi:hypothetical protein
MMQTESGQFPVRMGMNEFGQERQTLNYGDMIL